jgi:hypothetical protein
MVSSHTKRNTFDVKWYEDTALAYWVGERPVPAEKFGYDQVVWDHQGEIIEQTEKTIDSYHTMRVTMFNWGWVIETCWVDEDYTVTLETLISYDGCTATITHRTRYGPNCNRQAYPRDNHFPIPSIVRLRP